MIDESTLEQAAQSFKNAANAKGAMAFSPNRDDALHAEMTRAISVLRSAGPDGAAKIRLFLRDASPFVRSWAAAELLSSGDVEAADVLADLAELAGPIGLNAEMVLVQHREGRLQSPFRGSDV